MRALICCLLLFCCGFVHAGDLTRRQELTLHRVLEGGPPRYTDDFLLADVLPKPGRRFTNFSGDLSGRYIEALSVWSLRTGRSFPGLDPLVAKVLAQQKPDGHFGNAVRPSGGEAVSGDDMARMWGNGRLLVGLIEYYRLRKKPEVLAAARRLADFFVAQAPAFNADGVMRQFSGAQVATGYICWTQNIEGLALLYQLTGEARYRELADQLATRTAPYPRQHSHGFLTSLRGILLLHEATHEKKYLDQVQAEWKALADSENLLVQGAIPEVLAPGIERDEGCSEADWLRLSLRLWKLTGTKRYLEEAERTYFNEFSFNQFATGDFGHHKFSSVGIAFENARAWWCCTLHGLRAFADLSEAVLRHENGTVYYDMPVDAVAAGKGAGDVAANFTSPPAPQSASRGGMQSSAAVAWAIAASSSLENDASVRITAKGGSTRLAIRQPAWAASVLLAIGGRPAAGALKDGYVHLPRELKAGETIEIRYTMKTRVVPDARQPGMAAMFHGPWLLGVNERTSPYFFDEPYSPNQRLNVKADADGSVRLERAGALHGAAGTAPSRPPQTPRRTSVAALSEAQTRRTSVAALSEAQTRRIAAAALPEAPFAVPAAHFSVEFAPGGYALQPAVVTLVPLAEKTAADPPARWQFLFRLQ